MHPPTGAQRSTPAESGTIQEPKRPIDIEDKDRTCSVTTVAGSSSRSPRQDHNQKTSKGGGCRWDFGQAINAAIQYMNSVLCQTFHLSKFLFTFGLRLIEQRAGVHDVFWIDGCFEPAQEGNRARTKLTFEIHAFAASDAVLRRTGAVHLMCIVDDLERRRKELVSQHDERRRMYHAPDSQTPLPS